MKQFIVLCSSIALGLIIYNLIAGRGDSSVWSLLADVWQKDLQIRSMTP